MNPEKCFISYSSKDRDFANLLYSWLNLYPQQIEPWMDRDIEGGKEWERLIKYQINNSTIFLPIITRSFEESDYCIKELQWFHNRILPTNKLRIIPIKIDGFESPDPRIVDSQWVDFSSWAIEGDKIFLQSLLPCITQTNQHPQIPYPETHLKHSIIELEALKEILTDYRHRLADKDKARHLITLVIRYIQNDTVDNAYKATLATELADLLTQKGEWKNALKYSILSLELLAKKGFSLENLSSIPDNIKVTIGLNLRQFGLLARKLRDGNCEKHLKDALNALNTLSDPILRQDNCAQVHRELTTFFMIRGDLNLAKQHATESHNLLKNIPSQQYHLIQAKNQIARIAIFENQLTEAKTTLDEIALVLTKETTEHYSKIVYCQFLLTRLLLYILSAQPYNLIKQDLDDHHQIANSLGLNNELFKNKLFQLATPFRKIIQITPRKLILSLIQFVFRS